MQAIVSFLSARRIFWPVLLLLVTVAGCAQEAPQSAVTPATIESLPEPEVTAFAAVTTERIIKSSPAEEWLSYGGGYDEQRHSALTAVNRETVTELGVAWTYDLKTNRGVESTPIVVDGVMYVTSAWSMVHALDAQTGKELWVYDPKVDKAIGVRACCGVVNRGVAVYDGQVFVGVIDGRLEALDARTGTLNWSIVTVDQSKPYTITGAPRVVNGKVMIGNGGAEFGVRGFLTAYDANNGEKIWRFYTVPNPNKEADNEISDEIFAELANDSWGDDGRWVSDGGGGTVWDSIVYDAVNKQIIFGVGNGSPWNRNFRDPAGGDNLFLSSMVAVDAKTGRYRWHFQTTPGDNWDYTATQSIILADLPLGEGGAPLRVAMQAPKNGFFYVINAASGKFISGNAFGPMNWATGLDVNGRPIEADGARYGKNPVALLPGPLGAHNWHPMAYSPELELAYIPAQEIPAVYAEDSQFDPSPLGWNTGTDFAVGTPPVISKADLKAARAALKGRLIAWDPKTQQARWSVEHPNAWNGGVLSTAGGLVFQGRLDGLFVAYDAATGEKLWSDELYSGANSGPATYEIDGTQFVTITTGWGSLYALAAGFAYDEKVSPSVGKVVTFKLNGNAQIAKPNLPSINRATIAAAFGSDQDIVDGSVLYARNCAVCHGPFAISSGVLPDLRWSPITTNADSWKSVLLDGVLAQNGMVSFAEHLSAQDAEKIRAYVVAGALNDMQERSAE
jgi:quinohemoprotein ethanol dehydrogenase